MWRINKGSIDFKWGSFTPQFGLALFFDYSYEDNHPTICVCLIWGQFNIHIWKGNGDHDVNNTPRYGINLNDIADTFSFNYGVDKYFTWYLPFFFWHFDSREVHTKKHIFEIINDQTEYPWIEKNALQETYKYTYILNSGEVQSRQATVYRQRMTWSRKWFPWIKLVHNRINVNFDKEVGERTGSWKGGTMGCDYDINEGECVLSALRRMEETRRF